MSPVIGSGNEVMLPGFVNGHHHVGLTPVQLGSPDMPLELWFVTRMVMRNVNLYLDTLYSAFEMIASGVTTVQHLHGWMPGKLDQVDRGCDEVIRAYQDVGMRVSYSYAVRDQNRLVYQRDEDFVASLPAELRGPMQRWFERFQLTLDDDIALFEGLYGRYHDKRRVKVQLAPANLHWCSDEALTRLADCSRKYDVPMHMHLLETAYQKEYARRRGGCTAVEYIDRFGLLGPQMTLGHGVWLNEKDIERLAETGTCVCHNCSSNFRLRSGVAALNKFEAAGINTAIGIDEAGINDDRDMLQEMRMVLRAHRVPGMDDEVPTPAQVFRMATSGGAKTTPFARHDRRARGRPGCRHRADRLARDQLPLSRRRDAAARCGPAARQDRRRAHRDLRRRGDLPGRQVHQGGPRRRAAGVARGPAAGAVRRRGRTAPALQVVAAACAGILCQLLRPRAACAVLSAEFPAVAAPICFVFYSRHLICIASIRLIA